MKLFSCRRIPVCLALCLLLLSPLAMFGAGVHTNAMPVARVTAKIDNGKRITLVGHLPSAVRRSTDLGRLPANTPVGSMIMLLQSSPEQKHELRKVLDQQQDKNSANFHQWMTPEEFGDRFGIDDSDIAQVKTWLQQQGLTVDEVAKSKRLIRFSGTSGQVEGAFQTQLHSLQLNGENHVAAVTDISVPAALKPVIAGVTLHNFFRKGHLGPVQKVSNIVLGPEYTSSSSVHYVGPGDFATIYNTTPLLQAGIDGTGQSIAVVGRSDILMSDVQAYRQIFNLPVNDPIFINAGQDNGIEPGDDGESDLDVEISGGIAPKAKVYFVVGTPTFFVDGITNSIQYIVENNLADIMSISYGSCESAEGAGGNEYDNQIFEQAAAQGISVFVASGDNGPAQCDSSNSTSETGGYATGAEASTPYAVSVGGTEMYQDTGASFSTYWGATTNSLYLNSALEYIPEYPWNEAKGADFTSTASSGLSGLWSGSGGVSSYYLRPSWQTGPGVPVSDPDITLHGGNWIASVTITNGGTGYTTAPTVAFGSGCGRAATATSTVSGGSVTGVTFTIHGFNCTTTPTVTFSGGGGTGAAGTAVLGPMWNTPPLVTGVPHRLTPDIALNAASGHDATIFCSEGVCGEGYLGLVGGTSVAAPSMAGIQALINQKNGGRQGMPTYMYYTLAAADNATNCNSANNPVNGSNCAFQDVTVGDNYICGLTGSGCSTATSNATTKIGFPAGPGYDLATGLGSPNAYNLATQWGTVPFNSTTTTLGLSQTTFAHGTPITLSGAVSGTGTPTGDVAFIVSQGEIGVPVDPVSGAFAAPGAFATLSGGSYSASLASLPGGTYNVSARYGGDSANASSLSAPVQVTVSSEPSVITITPQVINLSACTLTNGSTFTYGQLVWVEVAVAGASGQGIPTGSVSITIDGNSYTSEPLDPNGKGYIVAGNMGTSANSCLYGYAFSQAPMLQGGTHTIGATYSGDATFQTVTVASGASVTVSPIATVPTLTAAATLINNPFTDQFTVAFPTVTALTAGSYTPGASGPTGTVTFTDTTTSTVLGTASVTPVVIYNSNDTSTSSFPSYTYSATATFSTAAITASGANAITATYSGDNNFTGATTSAVTVTVGSNTSTTTVVTNGGSGATGNPSTINARPTFTATVAAATAGTVNFYDGTTFLGAGSTVGTAHTSTFRIGTTVPFVGGIHSITATYVGSGSLAASTSAPYMETVTQGTTAIALAGKTVGVAAGSYAFQASLGCLTGGCASSPDFGTAIEAFATLYSPTANVQFYDGATLLGSAPPQLIPAAAGGYGLWTADFSTSALAAGTHTITATYSDTNYALSTSNAMTVYVGTGSVSLGIYSPLSGAILSSNSATFKWFPVAGASYWVDIGSTQGGNNIYQSGNLGSPLSLTVNTLPTDGSTVWVRLWYLINGNWSFTDASYTAYTANNTPATMATPTPGSNLSGTTQTFTWNAGPSATNYWLDIGSSAGGNQYYQSGSLPNSTLQANVSGLPSDGSTIYVTLYSKITGNWVSNAYTYLAYNAASGKATMATPTNGSIFTATSETFTWNPGAGASAYWLDAGNVVGGNQYYQSGNLGAATSTTVNGLPVDGSTVYVRLYSYIGSSWLYNDYSYTALSYSKASITSPTPTSILTSNSVNFQWSTGIGASAYWLDVGTSVGGNQIYQSGSQPNTTTNLTVSGLPTDGSTVYVRLYTLLNGVWQSNDYTFTAATFGPATISSPTNGSMINGGSATFSWSAAQGASNYWVDIGTSPNGNDIYQSGALGNVTSAPVSGLPTDGSTIYVTLYSYIGGSWQSSSASYTTGP